MLQLVLAYQANCLKNNLVLANTMTKCFGKAFQVLDPRVERLVVGSSTALEFSKIFGILGVGGTNNCILVLIPVYIVANDPFASRDFFLEALVTKDVDVRFPSLKRTIHLYNKPAMKN